MTKSEVQVEYLDWTELNWTMMYDNSIPRYG